MAAEVELDIPLPYGIQGYLVPISSFDFGAAGLMQGAGKRGTLSAFVYVFDEASSTVKRREIVAAGVLGNRVIIAEGVQLGDIVASAGVSYLHDGMKVSLLPLDQ
jgi:hypothetical protein